MVKGMTGSWDRFHKGTDAIHEGYLHIYPHGDFPGGSVVKNPLANAGDAGDMGSIPVLGRSHSRGNGNPFQYSCLEKFHGQRSLLGYSLWDCKELDMTEHAPPTWTNHLTPKHFQISYLELELSIWILRRHKSSVYNTLLPASKIHVHLTCHQLKNLSLQSHLKIEIRYEWIQGMIHLQENSIPVVNLLNQTCLCFWNTMVIEALNRHCYFKRKK